MAMATLCLLGTPGTISDSSSIPRKKDPHSVQKILANLCFLYNNNFYLTMHPVCVFFNSFGKTKNTSLVSTFCFFVFKIKTTCFKSKKNDFFIYLFLNLQIHKISKFLNFRWRTVYSHWRRCCSPCSS